MQYIEPLAIIILISLVFAVIGAFCIFAVIAYFYVD